jgi:DNA-directed RNA polymerase specialized sigma24 family protein
MAGVAQLAGWSRRSHHFAATFSDFGGAEAGASHPISSNQRASLLCRPPEMRNPETTNWRLILDAAAGSVDARNAFALRYLPVVAAYLRVRWRSNQLIDSVDDAVQEVFVDLFRQQGVLTRADPDKGGFRALLFGTIQVVALRFEEAVARRRDWPAPSTVVRNGLPDEEGAARAYDRVWAQRLLAEARELLAARLRARGGRERRWHDLLELRFNGAQPIRDIARLWAVDPAWLHHEYAQAREAFRLALLDTMARYQGGTADSLEAECRQLLELLA